MPQNYQCLTDLLIRVDPLAPAQAYNPNTLIIDPEDTHADHTEATGWDLEESNDETEETHHDLRASGSSSDIVSTDALRAAPRGPRHLRLRRRPHQSPKANRKLEPQLKQFRVVVWLLNARLVSIHTWLYLGAVAVIGLSRHACLQVLHSLHCLGCLDNLLGDSVPMSEQQQQQRQQLDKKTLLTVLLVQIV